ncbi:hypothetical protein BGW39_010111 [Mortierella sp. 14UC]|nr:hypothetical protein BGW39_010111 [Mortierella sp. 14UC]
MPNGYHPQKTPVAYLPEILTAIGSHLDRQDLLSCVQVCRLWNQLFTPSVWATIDYKYISNLKVSPQDDRRRREVFIEWLRHLKTYYDFSVSVAIEVGKCTRLTSLTVVDVSRLRLDPADDGAGYYEDIEYPLTASGPHMAFSNWLISPVIKGILPSNGYCNVMIFKLQTLLERLPALRHYICDYIPAGFHPTKYENIFLTSTFPLLEILELNDDQVTPAIFFNLLLHLLNMVKLNLNVV